MSRVRGTMKLPRSVEDLRMFAQQHLGESIELPIHDLEGVQSERSDQDGKGDPLQWEARREERDQFPRPLHLGEREAGCGHRDQSDHVCEELEDPRSVEVEYRGDRGEWDRTEAAVVDRGPRRTHEAVELQDHVDRDQEHVEDAEQVRKLPRNLRAMERSMSSSGTVSSVRDARGRRG